MTTTVQLGLSFYAITSLLPTKIKLRITQINNNKKSMKKIAGAFRKNA